jgi:hypothetical protein
MADEPTSFSFEGVTVTATVKGDCGRVHTVDEWYACRECGPKLEPIRHFVDAMWQRECDRLLGVVLGAPGYPDNVATRLTVTPDGQIKAQSVDLFTPRCSCRVVHTCGFVCC